MATKSKPTVKSLQTKLAALDKALTDLSNEIGSIEGISKPDTRLVGNHFTAIRDDVLKAAMFAGWLMSPNPSDNRPKLNTPHSAWIPPTVDEILDQLNSEDSSISMDPSIESVLAQL